MSSSSRRGAGKRVRAGRQRDGRAPAGVPVPRDLESNRRVAATWRGRGERRPAPASPRGGCQPMLSLLRERQAQCRLAAPKCVVRPVPGGLRAGMLVAPPRWGRARRRPRAEPVARPRAPDGDETGRNGACRPARLGRLRPRQYCDLPRAHRGELISDIRDCPPHRTHGHRHHQRQDDQFKRNDPFRPPGNHRPPDHQRAVIR